MTRALVAALAAVAAMLTATLAAVPTATLPGTPAPALALCSEEDGSAPGQSFPCFWTGGSNGQGETYVLVSPAALVGA